MESIIIRTNAYNVNEYNVFTYHYKDISRYDLEYMPNVIRIDFKDGSYVEFTRNNIMYVEVRLEKGEE